MSRTLHRLSQLGVSNAGVGMHADGGGLYLQVTKTVSGRINKSWLYRYAVSGRERQMGLGSLSEVKLSTARQKAAECREQRLEGIDPIEARDRARHKSEASGITFRRAFETFFATKRNRLSNAQHAAQWRSTMQTYVFPSIGDRPVADVEAREITDLRINRCYITTKLAFEWLVLTATRSGEARLARWSEIDEHARVWNIPAERMKSKRSHVVPLSDRCLEILKQARASYPSFS